MRMNVNDETNLKIKNPSILILRPKPSINIARTRVLFGVRVVESLKPALTRICSGYGMFQVVGMLF
jgi:hypothetical protein